MTGELPTGGVLEKVSAMLTGQPIYIILLTGVLGAVGYGAFYGLPAIVTQIQTGYEAMEGRHQSERKELREDAKAERREFLESVEKVGVAVEKLSEKIK